MTQATLKARLTSSHFIGLNFTVCFLVLIVAGFLFGLVSYYVFSDNTLLLIDLKIAQWLHSHASSSMTQWLLILTHLHDPIIICLMVALIEFYLIWAKRWYEVLTVFFVVPGGMLLNLLIKNLFERARPTFEDPLIFLSTYSFPSGHVVATTLFYGVLTAFLITKHQRCSQRAFIFLLAISMVAIVAFTRLYLGAHYLSDVMAAFFEAIAWLVFCLLTIRAYLIYHEHSVKRLKH